MKTTSQPGLPEAMARFASPIALRETGRYEEACQWLHEWLARRPEDAEAWSLLCQIYLLEKKDEEASRAYKVAHAISPALPSLLRNKARIQLKQGKPATALSLVRSIYEKFPDDIENWLLMAACLSANQKDSEALLMVEKVLQSGQRQAEAYANRAVIRVRAKDVAGALSDAEHALAEKPHLKQVWVLVSILRYQSHNLDGAIDAFKRICLLEPANVSHMVSLGELYRQNGQIEDAVTILGDAVQKAPDNADVRSNYETVLNEASQKDHPLTH